MRRAQLIGLAVIVVASGLWATPAAGQESGNTGNDLIQFCEGAEVLTPGTRQTNVQGYCLGLVRGVAQTLRNPQLPNEFRACFPDNATVGQMIRVVNRYLEDHPERLHLIDDFLVAEAVLEAFPCSP
jgi:hypothetical protein